MFALWRNRTYPGLALAFVGIAFNGIAIVVNGGRMPVWDAAYATSGLEGPINSVLHFQLSSASTSDFLRPAGISGRHHPDPARPLVRNVASVGDLFLAVGLGFFLFATLICPPERELDPAGGAGVYEGIAGTARLPRPVGPPSAAGMGVRAERD